MVKTVLVTGADGFVGAGLTHALKAQGYTVREASRRTVGDISGETDWRTMLEGADAVIHLANRAHIVRERARDPEAVFRRVNVEGTVSLARQATAAGVKRFVYISSISVNGALTEGAAFCEENPPAPGTPYARSKWAAEMALQEIARHAPMELVILRPPLVYGPGVKANFLALLRAIDRCFPLPLRSVRNERHFVALRNLTEAILLALRHPAAAGQIFLVADDEAVSTPQLIRHLAALMGRSPRLLPFPVWLLRLAGRVMNRQPAINGLCASLRVDNAKIKNLLGWNPAVSLSEGLAETVDWYIGSYRGN